MNNLVYPIVMEALQNSNNNILLIELYDSFVNIYRKDKFIVVQDSEHEIFYNYNNFNFVCNKPIEKVTIIGDKYGSVYSDIFNKVYFKAAFTIQQAWKNKKESFLSKITKN